MRILFIICCSVSNLTDSNDGWHRKKESRRLQMESLLNLCSYFVFGEYDDVLLLSQTDSNETDVLLGQDSLLFCAF